MSTGSGCVMLISVFISGVSPAGKRNLRQELNHLANLAHRDHHHHQQLLTCQEVVVQVLPWRRGVVGIQGEHQVGVQLRRSAQDGNKGVS